MVGAGWFGATELLIILGIVVLIFGARRLVRKAKAEEVWSDGPKPRIDEGRNDFAP